MGRRFWITWATSQAVGLSVFAAGLVPGGPGLTWTRLILGGVAYLATVYVTANVTARRVSHDAG
ncbi:hypothetical protein ACIO1C_29590 [Streptomyces sp. NPDC087420]|uniref:hypothetical protein n=1 Tax=Streptomyces sp. NPDC087420 TaxID=3365785 RepID=UPI0038343AB5